jgi:hypothetical protein
MCRGFSEAWKRQQAWEQQQLEVKEFESRAERLTQKIEKLHGSRAMTQTETAII